MVTVGQGPCGSPLEGAARRTVPDLPGLPAVASWGGRDRTRPAAWLPGCLAQHRGSRGKLTWALGPGAPSDLAFISVGNCTWGMNCRFIHPGVNDKGNYSLITKAEPFPPNGAPPLGPHPLMPANPWVREHLFHC